MRMARGPVSPMATGTASSGAAAALRCSRSSSTMCTAAEVSGAASVSPTMPNRAPPPIGDDQDRERVDAERRAHHERLDQLLEHAVAQQRDDRHDDRRVRALGAERDEHRERAGHPCAEVRDVRTGEGDDRDRPGERHADDQRREPDEDAVERGDDRDAQEVAAQRLGDVARHDVADRFRDPEMPVDEAAHHRAVLEHEERAERREREEEQDRRQAVDALRDAAQQRRADLGRGLLGAVHRRSARRRRRRPRASPRSCRPPGSSSPRCRPSWR